MNKEQFLLALYDALRGLPVEDVERSIAYYREMIDERVEDGMSEEEAVAALGSVDEIAEQILSEVPLHALVRERVTDGRQTLPAWEIALLVLGAPLWFAFGVTALSLLFAFYVTIWALVLAFGAVAIALGLAGVAGVLFCVPAFLRAGFGALLTSLGGGLVCGGIATTFLLALRGMVKGTIRLSGRIWLWAKSLFVRKEAMA